MSFFSKSKLSSIKNIKEEKIKHTVLVVDDEDSNLMVMNGMLKDAYNVITAKSGTEALALINAIEGPEKISVVISDQRMPEMTGASLLSEVARIIPNTMRIIVSGFTDVNLFIQSINEAHIYKFLLKPLDRNDFLFVTSQAVELYEKNISISNLSGTFNENDIALLAKNKELIRNSLCCPISNLKNFYFLEQYIHLDIAQSDRAYSDWNSCRVLDCPTNSDLIFIKVSVDNFSMCKDKFSKGETDSLIKEMKIVFENTFRLSDFMVHCGNGQFVIVIRLTNRSKAEYFTQRLIGEFDRYEFSITQVDQQPITCSMGYALYPLSTTSPNSATWNEVLTVAARAEKIAQESSETSSAGIEIKNNVDGSLVSSQLLSGVCLDDLDEYVNVTTSSS